MKLTDEQITLLREYYRGTDNLVSHGIDVSREKYSVASAAMTAVEEVMELRKIVDKLPKDANGKTITPGDILNLRDSFVRVDLCRQVVGDTYEEMAAIGAWSDWTILEKAGE
jgi:hypothetical protein